jgi:hypothetical protein
MGWPESGYVSLPARWRLSVKGLPIATPDRLAISKMLSKKVT